MSLVDIILILILAGVLIWFVHRVLPLRRNSKSVLDFIVVVLAVLWLLHGLGVLGHSGDNLRLPDIK